MRHIKLHFSLIQITCDFKIMISVPIRHVIALHVYPPVIKSCNVGMCSVIVAVILPNTGTEDAVGGAASTKINRSTRKLENKLMAEKSIEMQSGESEERRSHNLCRLKLVADQFRYRL